LNDLQEFRKQVKGKEWTCLKASPPTKHEVGQRNANIVIDDFSVSFRCIVVPINVHGPDVFDAWVIGRHQYYGLLEILILVVWVRLSHDNMKLAARIACSRDPPFVTVDDDFVTLATNRGLDIGGVRRGNLGIS
jgi:hypothetical protein